MTPLNLWTPSATNWVSDPAYIYEQALDVGSVKLFATLNTIRMGTTAMGAVDEAPSSTFTSLSYNIFS